MPEELEDLIKLVRLRAVLDYRRANADVSKAIRESRWSFKVTTTEENMLLWGVITTELIWKGHFKNWVDDWSQQQEEL